MLQARVPSVDSRARQAALWILVTLCRSPVRKGRTWYDIRRPPISFSLRVGSRMAFSETRSKPTRASSLNRWIRLWFVWRANRWMRTSGLWRCLRRIATLSVPHPKTVQAGRACRLTCADIRFGGELIPVTLHLGGDDLICGADAGRRQHSHVARRVDCRVVKHVCANSGEWGTRRRDKHE